MIRTLMLAAVLLLFSGGSAPAGAPDAAAASAVPSAKPGLPRRIPTKEFAQKDLLSRPLLSPDGRRMVGRFNIDGVERLGIHSMSGEKLQLIALPEGRELRWYKWAGNNRVLLSISSPMLILNIPIYGTRLLVYDLRTKEFLPLGPKDQALEGDDLLYVDPQGEWILLSFQKSIFVKPMVGRVDLATNKIEPVVAARGDVSEWYADGDGVVRAGVGSDSRGWGMVYRQTVTEKFRRLPKVRWDDEDAALDVLRFTRGSDDGFVLSNKATGRFALYKYNYVTKAIGEPVFESATNDVTGFSTAKAGTVIQSAWYTDDRDRIHWFQPELQKLQDQIDAANKANENWITSRSEDESAMIIWAGASNNPGSYYLYRPAEGVMVRLAKVNNSLNPAELAVSRYVKYKARDGLEIPGYLTLPKGRDPKKLPLVIMPHGGPYDIRDNSDYDPQVQLLANRGYAVLQPNYRGSGGYGKAFYEKGEGQWGRQMQDDLDDGMDWLVQEGIADPTRVCIVGGSYGGYAALWGATRNPERYRCAASYAGVSDLTKQLSYQISFRINKRYRKNWREIVQGPTSFDTRSVSPLYLIDGLKVPVLLMHGDSDQSVPYAQSKDYAAALKAKGKTYEFYTHAGEGHGFSSSANLQDWLDRLDAFLARYNPA